MSAYDPQKRNKISKSDIPKVFQKLGLVNMSESEVNLLLRAGSVKPEEHLVDYYAFSSKLIQVIREDIDDKVKRSKDLLNDLTKIIKDTKISIFDMFCILDVNNRGGISFIELKTGL